MKRSRKDRHFIKKPVYPGGRRALMEFIRKNLRYPEEALAHEVEGTVNLKYTIDHKGNVTDVHIISGPGYGCDEEAIRLVKLLKFAVPKSARGIKVQYHKDLHIHFRLPKPAGKRQLHYTVTRKKPSGGTGDQSYGYSIEIPGGS